MLLLHTEGQPRLHETQSLKKKKKITLNGWQNFYQFLKIQLAM